MKGEISQESSSQCLILKNDSYQSLGDPPFRGGHNISNIPTQFAALHSTRSAAVLNEGIKWGDVVEFCAAGGKEKRSPSLIMFLRRVKQRDLKRNAFP